MTTTRDRVRGRGHGRDVADAEAIAAMAAPTACLLSFLMAAMLCVVPVVASAAQPATFSGASPGDALPAGWTVQPLPKVDRPTQFDLVDDFGTTVLRARADNAMLSWRWKTDRVLAQADLTKKSGDDFATRLYVFFDRKPAQMSLGERALFRLGRSRFGDQLPAAALCYVWDNRQPVDTLRDNAYTGLVRMVVATSGSARQGQWVTLKRDIATDYRRAFGTAPPAVTGIAVAADTDNTGESTVSYFGDIQFLSGGKAR